MCNINQNDTGLMEKKITKKFYLISSLNILTALWLGNGLTLDSLALIGSLIILVLNHTTMVKMIFAATQSMILSSSDAKRSLRKALLLILLKITLLAIIVFGVYFYNVNLIPKLLISSYRAQFTAPLPGKDGEPAWTFKPPCVDLCRTFSGIMKCVR